MDIVERLRRSEGPFWSHERRELVTEAAASIEQLRTAITAFGKALCLPDGPSLAVQRHDQSWEAWKTLCDVSAGIAHQQSMTEPK